MENGDGGCCGERRNIENLGRISTVNDARICTYIYVGEPAAPRAGRIRISSDVRAYTQIKICTDDMKIHIVVRAREFSQLSKTW